MKGVDCYLSRRRTGNYILTEMKPVEKRVGDLGFTDLYAVPGDAMAWMACICKDIVYRITGGMSLRKMEIVPVTLFIEKR